jgi:hypothetical protein
MTVPAGLQAVVAAFDQLFEVDEPAYLVRRSQVSRAIAAALGVPWSPNLGRQVAAVAAAAGAYPVTVRVACYRNLRARSIDRDEVLLRSRAFRAAMKRPPAPDPGLEARAREALGKAGQP